MVRRVGFGGGEPPKKREAELRRRYHRVDGNHSDRAHKPETALPAAKPDRAAKQDRKPISRKRFWFYLILGFWALPMVFGIILQLSQFILYKFGFAPSGFLLFILTGAIVYSLFRLVKNVLAQGPA
ncbi:MAG: hypothetical protein L3J33_04125 [Rhodobacteraceae bacterium]|nr:hypothetical protein [Paracoccaceae bacterium]